MNHDHPLGATAAVVAVIAAYFAKSDIHSILQDFASIVAIFAGLASIVYHITGYIARRKRSE